MIYESAVFAAGCFCALLIGKAIYRIYLHNERSKIKAIIIEWGWNQQQVKEAMEPTNFPITRQFVYEKQEAE